MLAAYLDAEAKILTGQSVSFNGRTLTRADLDEIKKGRREWERKVAAENNQSKGLYGPRHMTADFSDG